MSPALRTFSLLLPLPERTRGRPTAAGPVAIGTPTVRRSVRQPRVGTGVAGLTLLELLVVLVLTSLLGTLVIQGTGFFLGRYETATRVGKTSASIALQRHWFASTVGGMVPSVRATRRFEGRETAFEGTTLRPLAGQPGQPTRVRWSIDPNDAGAALVVYAEEGRLTWTVLTVRKPGLSFEYADAAGRWYARWPLDPGSKQSLPGMVRLVSHAGDEIWAVRPDVFPRPVVNFRDFS